jgi:hypothetical protein
MPAENEPLTPRRQLRNSTIAGTDPFDDPFDGVPGGDRQGGTVAREEQSPPWRETRCRAFRGYSQAAAPLCPTFGFRAKV